VVLVLDSSRTGHVRYAHTRRRLERPIPEADKIVARLILSFMLASFGAFASDFPAQVISLNVGNQKIHAEVASTQAALEEGLMNRESLGENEGMLFVFKNEFKLCMWMKDTKLPLSVAFIDRNGFVLNIVNMQPLSSDFHCAGSPAQFALEMNAGWFEKHGVTPGAKVRTE